MSCFVPSTAWSIFLRFQSHKETSFLSTTIARACKTGVSNRKQSNYMFSISRVEAEKEAENAVVDAASRGHFLEQQIANLNNYNYKADESFDREATVEDQEHAGLKPKSKRKKSKGKNVKSKYGYKYDGFIDDSEEIDSDDDWEENSEPKAKKKTKGRPKKIKEEDEEKTQQPEPNLNAIDPLTKAREDAIERTFHELNEFYNLQSDAGSAQMTFNQVKIS